MVAMTTADTVSQYEKACPLLGMSLARTTRRTMRGETEHMVTCM